MDLGRKEPQATSPKVVEMLQGFQSVLRQAGSNVRVENSSVVRGISRSMQWLAKLQKRRK